MNEITQTLKKNFSGKEGVISFFIGVFIWGFLIVKWSDNIFAWLYKALDVVKFTILRSYLSYLLLGVIFLALGIIVPILLIKLLHYLQKKIRERK